MAAILQVGDVLAQRYTIEAVLGHGGMGAVYKAADFDSERHWAIKEMNDSFDDPEERQDALESFKVESAILGKLEHQNLPRITQCFNENGRQYIVMDLVEGETVEKLLDQAPQGRLTLEQVLNIAVQLTDVLNYLHTYDPPIIFRDLKPGNIMVTPKGIVKLIDFGIARFFTKGKNADTRALGTPGYAAPEQYGRGQSDARTDIYALGASLHRCLTGKSPDENMFSFEPPSKFVPSLPKALDEVILKCCCLKPDERWNSVKEFENALLSAVPVNLVAPDSIYAKVYAINLLATGSLTAPIKSGPAQIKSTPAAVYSDKFISAHVSQTTNTKASVLSAVASPANKDLGTVNDLHKLGPFPRTCIDFGAHYTSEGPQKTQITLQGEADGRLETSENWVFCRPEHVKGTDVTLDIFVDPGKMNLSGQHSAQIKLGEASMLVSFELLAKELGCLDWAMILSLTFTSWLPYWGFVADFILLIMWIFYSKELRSRILTFFIISLLLSASGWYGWQLLCQFWHWLFE